MFCSRQDTSDKVGSTLKPDSQKSTLEQAQDSVKSAGDSVASTIQPGTTITADNVTQLLTSFAESEKSTTQKASDTVGNTGEDQDSLLTQAQNAVSNAAGSVQEALGYGKSNTGSST